MKQEKRQQLKEQAEEAYANAILSARYGTVDGVKYHRKRALQLYHRLDVQTLEDACPTRMQVLGVNLPDIMHQGVVKQRLNYNGILQERLAYFGIRLE